MNASAVCQTFVVNKVTPATEPLPEIGYHQAVAEFLGGPVESCSRYHGKLVASVRSHPLIAALHAAFCTHRPLRLSPDIIWLTVCQGLANHVNADPEKFRHRLVKHEGKKTLTVRRDDFVKGSPENPWPEAFSEFSAQIREHIGNDTHQLIVADFSTTGPVERAAMEVALMDTMQGFFSYELHTCCGIPAITLDGTADDWRQLALRVSELRRFDLRWWIEPLEEVCAAFVGAALGKIKRKFWDSIYKYHGPRGSGSPHVSGWVIRFFPYLCNRAARYARSSGPGRPTAPLMRNPWLSSRSSRHGPGREEFPCLPAKAPFLWKYLGTDHEMEFVGGLLGVAQDPDTLCLRPEIGWAVREARPSPNGVADCTARRMDLESMLAAL
jgi:hypothetical protein